MLAAVVLEVFPTIVDSLAVEVMLVEVLLEFVVENTSRYLRALASCTLVINLGGRGLCGFVHVKLN